MARSGVRVERTSRDEWRVASQTRTGVLYGVTRYPNGWTCECPDFQRHGGLCKHVYALRFLLDAEPPEVAPPGPGGLAEAPLVPFQPAQPSRPVCPHCGGDELSRRGFVGKRRKQAYWCSPCRRKFVSDDGFRRLKGDARAVTAALDLYFKGVSLRNVADFLGQHYGLTVSHMTVYRWLGRYVGVLDAFAAGLRPDVGTRWNADEVKVKFGKDSRWLWHVLDRDTRFLLARGITEARDEAEARTVFAAARDRAGFKPDEVVTDGLPTYIAAWKQELRIPDGGRSKNVHIREISLSGHSVNNNPVERLNGTWRAREKPARGLKSPQGPLAAGQGVYYNFLRRHMGLAGRTPAEAAGIPTPAEGNRWEQFLRKAFEQERNARRPRAADTETEQGV